MDRMRIVKRNGTVEAIPDLRTPEQFTADCQQATHQALLKIAAAKIKAYKLPDTPEEYLEKCKANTAKEQEALYKQGSPYTTRWNR